MKMYSLAIAMFVAAAGVASAGVENNRYNYESDRATYGAVQNRLCENHSSSDESFERQCLHRYGLGSDNRDDNSGQN
jgi:hypothetical protein